VTRAFTPLPKKKGYCSIILRTVGGGDHEPPFVHKIHVVDAALEPKLRLNAVVNQVPHKPATREGLRWHKGATGIGLKGL
jgi:hypothetical protein